MLAHKAPLSSPAFLLIGIGSGIVGLLPWLISGMRLPLQNLWGTATLPADMPLTLLPFSQYFIFFIAALIVIGSTVAGIAGRWVAARHPGSALVALLGGVLIVQAIATAQTAIVVGAGLSDRAASTFYLVALTYGTVAAILLGLGMLALIARAPRAGALIAFSIAAIAFSSWLSGLLLLKAFAVTSPITSVLRAVIEFAPAVIIGVAIAWCGVNSVGRVIAAIAVLATLWVGPTLVTAVSAAVGSRVLAPYPAEMLDYGVGVFRMAIGMPELWLNAVLVAVVVAVVGLLVRRWLAGRQPSSESS